MVNTIYLSIICAIVLLSVGVCIEITIRRSDRHLQKSINNLRRSPEDDE